MLLNAYFLAKFGFDTAENKPAKNLQTFLNFANLRSDPPSPSLVALCPQLRGGRRRAERRRGRRAGAEANQAYPGEAGAAAVPERLRLGGEARRIRPAGAGVSALVERFDIEPYSDFSAK